MTTVSLILEEFCPGGGHVKVTLSKNAQSRTITYDKNEVRAALSAEDIETFGRVLLKVCSEGKTNNQFLNAITTGLSFTV